MWAEWSPALSPDETKIAFISLRTHDDEIWLYDMVNNSYRQLTGDQAFNFDSRYSNIEWLGNNQILITAFEDTKSVAVKLIVN
jgi:hypothetical protein